MTKTKFRKNKIFFTFKLSEQVKDLFFSALILVIMFVIIANPKLFSSGTIQGLSLFFYSVFPGLFPFMLLTKLLTEIGYIFKISNKLDRPARFLFGTRGISLYAFFMSILSGYPIGAQIIGDIYSRGLISKAEAKKMSLFCTTSGPIFIIGAVGVGMLGSFKLGVIIYASHILSSIILGIISKFLIRESKDTHNFKSNCYSSTKSSNIISSCVSQTINSLLIVGAYITIFYLVSELLIALKVMAFLSNLISPILGFFKVTPNFSDGIVYGLIEVTRGCKTLSSIVSTTSVVAICGLISFSGISIIMQSMFFLKDAQIKTHNFILGKVVHCLLSILICELIFIIA